MTTEKKYKLKKFGPLTERRDYSKTAYSLPVGDLVAAQIDSFKWLLDRGIEETIKSIYPIESSNGKIRIEYVPKSLRLDMPKSEFDTIKVAKQKGATYSFKIYAKLRKTDEETGEVLDQEVLFGELPLMTSGATFVINGFEKVVIAQLLRSPGAYYNSDDSRKGQVSLHNVLSIIPKYGVWLEIFHKTENIAKGSENLIAKSLDNSVRISIDKNKATSIATLLRALGMDVDSIYKLFGDTEFVRESIQKDKTRSEDEALGEIYNIIRKGDRVTEESKRNLFANLFFNPKRYDLSKTGRYLINRKLSIVERLENTILAENLVTSSGQVLFKKDLPITYEVADAIQDAFKQGLIPMTTIPNININVYGQNIVDIPSLKERNKVILVKVWTNKKSQDKKEATIVIGNDPNATEEILLLPDLIAAFSYYFNLIDGLGSYDDTDSLVNKRISSIGELLQNQLQVGMLRLERNAKERMSAKEAGKITPKNVTNNKLVYNQFKSFFNSSQLCQFMDQMNPLAELSNKRRVTSLGPGGLNRDRPYHEARDVHATHYGRLCPIETPEGPNIGLILNFAVYSRVNELGFIETPYFSVRNGVVDYTPVFLTASEEKGKIFAQSLLSIDKSGRILDKEVIARSGAEYVTVAVSEINFIDVSSKQITSIAASAIPFLENDDASRALMGANMQRQSVPLIKPEAPFVGTGVEADIAKSSASNLRALESGEVSYVDSEVIKIVNENNKVKNYFLRVFERSNQGSVISQRAIVKVGDKVKHGDLITDGPSFDQGELAIGKNVLVAFSTWNGYNFEDAIILSEKLVKDDVYTSIHIEEQTIEFRTSKIGDDELTYELPNVSNYARRNLNSQGIINLGSEVEAGDVLVGRVSPKGEDNPTPEEKLIAAIFAQKQKNVKDTSLKVKHGHSGTVIDVQILSREAGDVLSDDIVKIVKVLIAQKRKIQVGDKMSGRHGNKGVISRVLPVEDMPHLADGTPIDILLNPLGVPSRMNIGQVLELHLGLAARHLKTKFVTPVFDGIKYQDIISILEEAKLPKDGKFDLYDPISGRKFDNKVSVGIMYMLKLAHMVDDKVHARSVGPYSLITQQPLGGKTQNGGQRFGQMETWAVEAHGASNVLQELLTYKSDDIDGRNRVYNSIVTGAPLPTPGTPESFNVLAYELRGIGIKLSIETKEETVEEKIINGN